MTGLHIYLRWHKHHKIQPWDSKFNLKFIKYLDQKQSRKLEKFEELNIFMGDFRTQYFFKS